MKKNFIAILAGLALLGLAGCSGALHDVEVPKHEPVTIAGGNWFYYDITVFGDNDGKTTQLIINDGTNQSADTMLPAFTASTGGVFYFTFDNVGGGAKPDLLTSYQLDNPSYTLVPGKVRVYVYTDLASANAYYWGGSVTAPSWPGVAMTSMGTPAPSANILGCRIINIDPTFAAAGKAVYFLAAWVPGNAWNASGTNLGVVVSQDATYNTVSFTFPAAYESTSATLALQPRVMNDTTNFWDGTANGGNKFDDNLGAPAGNFTASGLTLTGGDYWWVLDAATGTASFVAD